MGHRDFFLCEGVVFINGQLQPHLGVQVIRNLKEALGQLLYSTMYHDKVATFALGEVFPLDYMVDEMKRQEQSVREKQLHLFEGLNWRHMPFDQKATFIEWTDSLPYGSSVLLFDMSNVGNAGRARTISAARRGVSILARLYPFRPPPLRPLCRCKSAL